MTDLTIDDMVVQAAKLYYEAKMGLVDPPWQNLADKVRQEHLSYMAMALGPMCQQLEIGLAAIESNGKLLTTNATLRRKLKDKDEAIRQYMVEMGRSSGV